MAFKKILAILMSVLVMVSFTACKDKKEETVNIEAEASEEVTVEKESEEKFNDENILDFAILRLAGQESFNAEMSSSFVFQGTDEKMSAETKADILYVKEPLFREVELNTYVNSLLQSTSEFYVIEEDGTNILAVSFEDGWYKMYASDEDVYAIIGQYDVKEVLKIFAYYAENIKINGTENINGKEVYKVNAVIDESNVADVIIGSGVFVANGLTNLYAEYFDGAEDMNATFYVDAQTGDILKLTYDAANAFQTVSDYAYNLAKETEEYKDSVRLVADEYSVKIIVNDINMVKGKGMPEEAENASWLYLPETEMQ